jgi:polysaccharide deacetylase family protein (PEP-CTERM system associated)
MSLVHNALTIDVEEHFQVHAFETVIDRSTWDSYPSRVVGNTRRILRLLAEYDVRATFFVLGWIADRHPDLVKEIAMNGHEVATHGYWHELIYRQTPDEFAEDLCRSLEAISRALRSWQPAGYRAPAFSITKQSLWALDILRNHSIVYDSSIFPLAAHDRYGINNASRFANRPFSISTVRGIRRSSTFTHGSLTRSSLVSPMHPCSPVFVTTSTSKKRKTGCERCWIDSSSRPCVKFSPLIWRHPTMWRHNDAD